MNKTELEESIKELLFDMEDNRKAVLDTNNKIMLLIDDFLNPNENTALKILKDSTNWVETIKGFDLKKECIKYLEKNEGDYETLRRGFIDEINKRKL